MLGIHSFMSYCEVHCHALHIILTSSTFLYDGGIPHALNALRLIGTNNAFALCNRDSCKYHSDTIHKVGVINDSST